MKRCILLITLLAMTACQHARLPLVGISCSRNASGGSTLSAAYSNAIAQSGGIPVILPTVSDPAVAASLLEELDGIVFSGGVMSIRPATERLSGTKQFASTRCVT